MGAAAHPSHPTHPSHPHMPYRHYKLSEGKGSSRQASTLVNLTAFRSVPSSQLDSEFETILMNSTSNKAMADKSSPLNSKAELV